MLQRSVELYERLEAETGQAIDWKQVGSLRLACSPDRLLEVKRLATMARSFGLEMQVIGPQEAYDLFPLIEDRKSTRLKSRHVCATRMTASRRNKKTNTRQAHT